jgi:cellobiose phosphorylase
MAPDLYYCEPYVTAGNVDGPDSPNNGRGGWTWYTGSAAWYAIVVLNWILGIRPVAKGLVVDPVLPKSWPAYKMKRLFRGTTYMIEVKNGPRGQGVKEIKLDGKKLPENIIPDLRDGQIHRAEVTLG